MSNGVDLTEDNKGGGGGSSDIIKSDTDPAVDSNLNLGDIWENTTTGEIYCCTDNTEDNNVWIGQFSKDKITNSTLDVVDIFDDGSGVALYQFDGDSTDTGGNYDGDATDVTYDTGKFGDAGVFNGSSSKIAIPSLGLGSSFSISMWLNSNDVTTEQRSSYNDGNDNIFIICAIKDSKIKLFAKDSGDNELLGNTTLDNNITYHVVWIFNSNGTQYIYLNNSEDGHMDVGDFQDLGSEYGRYIGTGRSNDGYYFNGWIDQVRIFNRALTDDEVDTLYNES